MDPENNPELTRANGPANAGANRGQSLNMQDPEGQRAQQANNVQGMIRNLKPSPFFNPKLIMDSNCARNR